MVSHFCKLQSDRSEDIDVVCLDAKNNELMRARITTFVVFWCCFEKEISATSFFIDQLHSYLFDIFSNMWQIKAAILPRHSYVSRFSPATQQRTQMRYMFLVFIFEVQKNILVLWVCKKRWVTTEYRSGLLN